MTLDQEQLDAYLRMHSPVDYGGIRFRVEGAPPMEGAKDPLSAAPKNLIRKKEYEDLRRLHATLVQRANTTVENGRRFEIVLWGDVTTGKVICLIYLLLDSCRYYLSKSVPYPGYRPSELLDIQNRCLDLKKCLIIVHGLLVRPSPELQDLQDRGLDQLYRVMRTLFDILGAWLPCDEVNQLRDLYETFQSTAEDDEKKITAAIENLCAQFTKVAHRFAAEEPKWEVSRAKGGVGEVVKFENEEDAAYFALHGQHKEGAKKGKHAPVSVKMAMREFRRSERWIHKWDLYLRSDGKLGKKPPDDYPGRHVKVDRFLDCAKRFRGEIE